MWTDVSEECITKAPAARWFLASLILAPQYRDDTFLRNVGLHTDYMGYGNIYNYEART
jgi:hypothetical protein